MISRDSIRNLALALFIGAVAALVIDAALQNALAAARSPGVLATTPWWTIGRVVDRSVWVAVASLVWLLSAQLARGLSEVLPGGTPLSRPSAVAIVGRAMIVAPLLWLMASWLVLVVRITVEGGWMTDGRIFATGFFYYNVLLAYSPWAGGGITLLALRRHLPD